MAKRPPRSSAGRDRRGIYFAFQGLLMAVLLLLFLYQYRGIEGWVERFFFLTGVLGGSLVFLRLASIETLSLWYVQAGLFLGDAALASLTLHWAQPRSDLYLIYFLIIFGTALTRNLTQSLVVALVTSLLYLLSGWSPVRGFPHDTGFWLRVHFLWVTASLLAILSRDAQQAQAEQEEKYRERLVQIERLATLGQVAGEVAHRIKGPLTTILVNAEVLAHRFAKSKETVKELKEIQDEVGRCKEILKNLLDLGRIEEMDFSPVDLRDPLRFALRSLEPRLKKGGIRHEVSGVEEPLMVDGDQSLLQEAISAVLHNAVDAAAHGGRIKVSVRGDGHWLPWRSPQAAPASYVLTIEDDGKGILAKDLERVFQPFFTTKADGSGLGLSAALRILQKHKGTVEAQSGGLGLGTRILLTLPKRPARGGG
ncbi:MAG: ATP-binding protein [Elusimicrobiota bacterium]